MFKPYHEFNIKMADVVCGIRTLYPDTEALAEAFLTDESPSFFIETSEEDVAAEERFSYESDLFEGRVPVKYPAGYLETLAVLRRFCDAVCPLDIILFHASAVMVDGKAYLFTAPSGTGKSTHAALWRRLLGDRAVVINDDKPFLRFFDDRITVYGSPYNGKHRLGNNISAPLAAIGVIKRGETNHVHTSADVIPMLVQQTYRPRDAELTARVMSLILRLARIPAYDIYCNMTEEAAVTSYEAMTGKRYTTDNDLSTNGDLS